MKSRGGAGELSRVEYAESKGWAPSYVTKLLKAERLVLTKDGKRIDVAKSERRLKETESVDRAGVREHHARRRKRKRAATTTPAEVAAPAVPVGATATPPAGAEPDGRNSDPTYEAYNASRAKREAALAAMAEMDQRLRAGELVEVSRVKEFGSRIGAVLARGLEQMSPRIAPVWSVESDPVKRERLFAQELRQIQEELAAAVAAIAAEGETQGG